MCLLSVVNWKKRTRGNRSQIVARDFPCQLEKLLFVRMVKHQNRMPGQAVTSPSSDLPRQGPRLPDKTFRVTYALGRRMKKEGPTVPSSPDLFVVLWVACFQHSSDEQTDRNVCDSLFLSCHK